MIARMDGMLKAGCARRVGGYCVMPGNLTRSLPTTQPPIFLMRRFALQFV
jgi:hypothetical protein